MVEEVDEDLENKSCQIQSKICEICFVGRDLQTHNSLNEEQQRQLKRYEDHIKIVKQQSSSYAKMMKGLKQGTAIIIFDYSTFNEITKFKGKILNFTVVFVGSNRMKNYKYYDYLAEAKADFRFTIAFWHHLLKELPQLTNFKLIEAWADGGLKTKETVCHMLKGGTECNIKININYFAPYHAHNLSDGHFSNIKLALRRKTGSGVISSRHDLVEVVKSRKNTRVFKWTQDKLEQISIGKVMPIVGIRTYFRFEHSNKTIHENFKVTCLPSSSIRNNSKVHVVKPERRQQRKSLSSYQSSSLLSSSPSSIKFSSSSSLLKSQQESTNFDNTTFWLSNKVKNCLLFDSLRDSKLIKNGKYSLCIASWKRLAGDAWINDEIINTYMELLKTECFVKNLKLSKHTSLPLKSIIVAPSTVFLQSIYTD